MANATLDYVSGVPAVRAFFYCVYALVFAVGVSGNALVCFVVARQRSMHTVTNLFIANLALSDILLCALAVPFTPLHQFVGAWPLGAALCRLVPFAQGVSVYVSSFTLTAIAVDRFFVIMHPFRSRLRLPLCGALIALIWLAGALLTLPYGLFMGLTADGAFCEERWPSERSRRAFSLCTSSLQFGLPFAVVSFCYLRVCCKLRERARAKPGAKSLQREQFERRRTRRTNRMLVSMVVIFGACWLPLNLYNLAVDFSVPAARWQFANAFFFLAHAVAMSSTCYNPFLYTWLNDSFRKEFKAVLPCFARPAEPPPPPPVRYVCSSDAVKLPEQQL
ncbi:prolactin-releasing peptide receptor-like isoform X2 [Amblyomma americanum]|uniref:G-protein coupled receptors family 1 profile domain-containing protein n=1 Tax=Amblyomma americanum TaxID=6943 RepID=A0AAQ4EBA8_AMBAM